MVALRTASLTAWANAGAARFRVRRHANDNHTPMTTWTTSSSATRAGRGNPDDTGRCHSPHSAETNTADAHPRDSPSWCTWASTAPRNATSSSRNVAGKYSAVYFTSAPRAAAAGSGAPVATCRTPYTVAKPPAPTAMGRAASRTVVAMLLARSENAAAAAPPMAAAYQPTVAQSRSLTARTP